MNSTTNSSRNRCGDMRYRDAIALNNAAIALLEQDCFKDAVEMLRIAIYLMQLSFCSIGAFDPNATLPEQMYLTDDDVSRHLMNTARFQSNVRILSSKLNLKDDFLKFSTQHEVGLLAESISKASQCGHKTVFIYIVIEPIDFDEIDLDSVYHDSMLILYNFGVAHYSLAGRIEESKNVFDRDCWFVVQELRQSAYQMLHVVEGYVCRKLSLASTSWSEGSGILMLSVLFSRTMSELSFNLRYTTVSDYYSVAYNAILILIERQGKTFPEFVHQAAAA